MFERFASWVDRQTARSATFVGACLLIVVWACFGPPLGFSDTWQLTINTGTTIVTFLMVFLLQNSQSRQTARHYHLTEKIERLEERLLRVEAEHGLLLNRIAKSLVREERKRGSRASSSD